jgi:hypothetical protein
MKKFSTQVFALALALSPAAPVLAQQATPPLQLASNAPDKHVVERGDTLWGIAGKFLDQPWRWPEIWQLNREQIANPHLIYPGDVVYLDNSSGTPRLRLGKPVDAAPAQLAQADLPGQNLQPRVRTQPLERAPVPTISAAAIEPFLTRPLIVDPASLASNPRIVGTEDGRVNLGRGDLAYVRGLTDDQQDTEWHVYRSANPLLDPDTRQTIAWEARFVGTARLERRGDPATFRILSTAEEIGPGDRLMPADRARPINYAPRPPQGQVNGRVVSVYRGVAQAGRNNVVSVNLGSAAGLAVGDVLAIKQRGDVVPDREAKLRGNEFLATTRVPLVQLPSEPIGHLLVFRVFDNIAYGLIMASSRAVSVGDEVANP